MSSRCMETRERPKQSPTCVACSAARDVLVDEQGSSLIHRAVDSDGGVFAGRLDRADTRLDLGVQKDFCLALVM